MICLGDKRRLEHQCLQQVCSLRESSRQTTTMGLHEDRCLGITSGRPPAPPATIPFIWVPTLSAELEATTRTCLTQTGASGTSNSFSTLRWDPFAVLALPACHFRFRRSSLPLPLFLQYSPLLPTPPLFPPRPIPAGPLSLHLVSFPSPCPHPPSPPLLLQTV